MLEGRVIIVTGGFGRLGPVVAETIESRGGFAIVTSRNESTVSRFNEESKRLGRRMEARTLRFSDEAELEQFVETVLAEHEGIHGLVNNAYAALDQGYEADCSFRSWETATRTNVASAVLLASALVDRREQSGIASIVNVGSIYGLVAPDFNMYPPERNPPSIEYGATKAALLYVTRYLAAQWGGLGVRVNAVSPGGIRHEQSEAFLERYAASVPMGRMVDKLEVAATICFLLGAESSGITGHDIVVDGGRCIW